MEKRKIIFGTYNTSAHGWTLTGWQLSPAEQKTQYVEKPNGDGSWDLSTVLSDGILRYRDRELVATFECSEGDRRTREDIIREMINSLDGMKLEIKLPDDDTHHVVGRLHVVREYNDLAHAAVSVTATCEPWKYADAETIIGVTVTTAKQHLALHNSGRRAVVPQLTVTGGPVHIEYAGATQTLSEGVYTWSSLLLTPGGHLLAYRGAGTLTVAYREAVLE